MEKLTRVSYKKEPRLKIFNWVIVCYSKRGARKEHVCKNRKRVRKILANIVKGQVAEVYRLNDNFVEAWTR